MISDEVLRMATERLVSRFHPNKIILFGSQARGSADTRSDVDILVICRFDGKRRRLMLEMDRSLAGLDCAFDVLIATPAEYERDRFIPGTTSRYAEKEGKVLYANPE